MRRSSHEAARHGLGVRVRVAAPWPQHRHMRGQVGMVTGRRYDRAHGWTYEVRFLGGRGWFAGSELERV